MELDFSVHKGLYISDPTHCFLSWTKSYTRHGEPRGGRQSAAPSSALLSPSTVPTCDTCSMRRGSKLIS